MAYDGELIFGTKVDGSGVESGISSLEGKFSALGGMLATAAKAATAAFTAAGVAAVKVGADFEAQMSRVKAISGATTQEFEQLWELAKQLGADTAFSASEAAAGMENLASAGFSANEIMGAMPGLLDLAAVSGGDVAAASEIAASALNAFGLEASEAGHVADVFARAAADTNAETADMGDAMKYVAPVAKAMGISLEEAAAAIGIMSDAGVKGSQAGTSLRGALSRLAKPTEQMMLTMQSLGVSFYDSEGNMISLKDQISVLKGSFEGLTQEQRNQALVTLYGQESLSGMLALIEAGPDQFDALTQSLINSDGAAAEMAATMQDNLKGALEGIGGQLETFGIEIYEQLQEPLKNAAQDISESLDNIYQEFKSGGITHAMAQFGLEIGAGISRATENLNELVDVGLRAVLLFIEGFTEGISNLDPKDLEEIIIAIADGLAKAVPALARAAVVIVRALGAALVAALPELRNAALELMDGLVSVLSLAVKDIPILDDIIRELSKNFDTLKPVIVAAAAAFSVFKSASMINDTVSKITSGIGSVKKAFTTAYAIFEIAPTKMDIVKAAISGLKTSFTSLFTAISANPIVLIIAAVAALVAGIMYLWNTNEDFRNAVISIWEGIKSAFSTAAEFAINAWNAVKDFFGGLWDWIKEAATNLWDGITSLPENAANAAQSAWDGVKSFFSDLWNGIKDGASGIWDGIKDTASSAAEAIQGVWSGFTSFIGEIWESIKTTAVSVWTSVSTTVMGILSPFIEILKSSFDGVKNGIDMVWSGIQTAAGAAWDLIVNIILAPVLFLVNLVTGNFEQLQADIELVWSKIQESAGTLWQGICDIISGIVTIAVNVIAGIWEAITLRLSMIWEAIVSFATAIWEGFKAKLIEIFTTLKDTLISIWEAFQNGIMMVIEFITQTIPQKFTELKDKAIEIFENIKASAIEKWEALKAGVMSIVEFVTVTIPQKWEEIKQKVGETITSIKEAAVQKWEEIKTGVANTVTSMGEAIYQTWDNIKQWTSDKWESVKETILSLKDIDLLEIGKNIIQGLIDGISSMIGKVGEVLTNVGNKIRDTITGTGDGGMDIHSPSRVMKNDVGRWIPAGLAEGIDDGEGKLMDKVKSMGKGIKEHLQNVTASASLDTSYNLALNSKANLDKFIGGSGATTTSNAIDNSGDVNVTVNVYPQNMDENSGDRLGNDVGSKAADIIRRKRMVTSI